MTAENLDKLAREVLIRQDSHSRRCRVGLVLVREIARVGQVR